MALPPKFTLLGLWPSNCWQPSEKQELVLTPEQALKSKAPVISMALKRFEIILLFPVGWR
jgi:hypothetical protein